MVNIDGLTTETVNEATRHIDTMSALEIVRIIHGEDRKVSDAIEQELPRIALAIDAIAERFIKGGRLIYCGAGSSGRMGVLDAVELTPTYSVSSERAFGIMAGGAEAMYVAVEGAEDSAELAFGDMERIALTADDCLIGIAASGRTPYTIAALEYGKKAGALTIAIICNQASGMAEIADISIAPVVGAEVISGSTRMKAGTAQKMIVNMLSTGAMVRSGKVYQNYMVHMQPTNEKLWERAVRMLTEITGIAPAQAEQKLAESGNDVAMTIVMIESQCGRKEADYALSEVNGNVRKAIALLAH